MSRETEEVCEGAGVGDRSVIDGSHNRANLNECDQGGGAKEYQKPIGTTVAVGSH